MMLRLAVDNDPIFAWEAEVEQAGIFADYERLIKLLRSAPPGANTEFLRGFINARCLFNISRISCDMD